MFQKGTQIEYGILGLIPPFIAILLALFSRSVFVALLSKVWVLKTLAFAMMVGSIMSLVERNSAMASGCNVQEHTRAQLSYALVSAAIALLFFMIAGWILV